MFKNWTWQKWLAKSFELAVVVGGTIWKLVAPEGNPNWEPSWWMPITAFVDLAITTIIGLIGKKQSA